MRNKRNTIRLNEYTLKRIIKESVKNIVNEITVLTKIPNFDRNEEYEVRNGEWMTRKEAIALDKKEFAEKRKAEQEKKEKDKKFNELLNSYRPLLDELETLEQYYGNLMKSVDDMRTKGLLHKLKNGLGLMGYIDVIFKKGDKHFVEYGFEEAYEALDELDAGIVNKIQIFNILEDVREILDKY